MQNQDPKKRCYYCGAKASSKEHAPPKSMFAGFECDKITVWSCEKHNNNKSVEDDAVIKSMKMSIKQTDALYPNRNNRVLKSVELSVRSFHQVSKNVVLSKISENIPDKLNVQLPYIRPSINIKEWMRQLAAALTYHLVGSFLENVRWSESEVQSPCWLQKVPEDSLEIEILKLGRIKEKFEKYEWKRGWSAGQRNYPKEIFEFWTDISENRITYKLNFFSSHIWYVELQITKDVFEILINSKKM